MTMFKCAEDATGDHNNLGVLVQFSKRGNKAGNEFKENS